MTNLAKLVFLWKMKIRKEMQLKIVPDVDFNRLLTLESFNSLKNPESYFQLTVI